MSTDIAEDTDPNSNISIELEADLNTLKSCDVVCRNVQRECEIVPIFLEMGGVSLNTDRIRFSCLGVISSQKLATKVSQYLVRNVNAVQ